MNPLEKITPTMASRLYWVAGSAIVAMMLLTCTDVVLRYFRKPIPGT
ncbi:MAG: TRAP transporter small permease, partial [Deltaproteobacteria bacterium]|nr:TRAP transporter small permease [Deltaproteobacteria bacterium]